MNEISIMIIDDDEVDRYLLQRQLKDCQLSLNIFEKSDGQEAIDFFLEYSKQQSNFPELYPPLIIFLDINMPRMDGLSFLETFKAIEDQINVKPIVIMMFTSSEDAGDKDKAFSYDLVKDFLIKGKFDFKELKERLIQITKNLS